MLHRTARRTLLPNSLPNAVSEVDNVAANASSLPLPPASSSILTSSPYACNMFVPRRANGPGKSSEVSKGKCALRRADGNELKSPPPPAAASTSPDYEGPTQAAGIPRRMHTENLVPLHQTPSLPSYEATLSAETSATMPNHDDSAYEPGNGYSSSDLGNASDTPDEASLGKAAEHTKFPVLLNTLNTARLIRTAFKRLLHKNSPSLCEP